MSNKNKRPQYSLSFKLEVLREFYAGDTSLSQFSEEKGIDKSTLSRWKNQYTLGCDELNMSDHDIAERQREIWCNNSITYLRDKVAQLERDLAMAKQRIADLESEISNRK